MSGKLYVVGTPIGNLGDFSPRAVKILSEVDFIAAEDTRVTLKLLNHFEIKKPLVSYFEHNKYEKEQLLVERILSGENCAVVTDAGMPCISDPGQDLVRAAKENGIAVESVPGPCAFVTALAASGMDSKSFYFSGFLPADKNGRRAQLESLKDMTCTLIFYEAPHKLKRTLLDMAEILGDREICLAKELTKLHENVLKTTIFGANEFLSANEPKGEYVLIVAGAQEKREEYTKDEAVAIAKKYLLDGFSASLAAKKAAQDTSIKKSEIYDAIKDAKK